jgi:UDPglucose 6-dehydrogenase
VRPLVRSTALEATAGADALAVLTDWPAFQDIPLDVIRAGMRGSVLFDGRNVLRRSEAEAAGFAYLGVGRTSAAPRRRVSDQ